ncbi:MAG: hypothetical protein ACP5MG_00060 [Verrucomicrobiia bacterium]
MKKLIAVVTAIGILGATSTFPVKAGDREWATAGKIMTGVVAGIALANLLAPEPPPVVYTSSSTVYVPQPQTTVVVPQTVTTVVTQQQVVVQSAPVAVQTQPAVVVQSTPVVVQTVPVVPAPVVVAPPPVVVYRPPFIVHHPPVFSFGYSRFHGHSYVRYGVCW